MLRCSHGEADTPLDPQLLVHLAQMGLDGSPRTPPTLRDLGVRAPFGEVPDDLSFSCGEQPPPDPGRILRLGRTVSGPIVRPVAPESQPHPVSTTRGPALLECRERAGNPRMVEQLGRAGHEPSRVQSPFGCRHALDCSTRAVPIVARDSRDPRRGRVERRNPADPSRLDDGRFDNPEPVDVPEPLGQHCHVDGQQRLAELQVDILEQVPRADQLAIGLLEGALGKRNSSFGQDEVIHPQRAAASQPPLGRCVDTPPSLRNITLIDRGERHDRMGPRHGLSRVRLLGHGHGCSCLGMGDVQLALAIVHRGCRPRRTRATTTPYRE